MKIINKGTVYCECCGEPLYDYVEYATPDGGTDGDIVHTYRSYDGNICKDCNEMMNEEEGEEEK